MRFTPFVVSFALCLAIFASLPLRADAQGRTGRARSVAPRSHVSPAARAVLRLARQHRVLGNIELASAADSRGRARALLSAAREQVGEGALPPAAVQEIRDESRRAAEAYENAAAYFERQSQGFVARLLGHYPAARGRSLEARWHAGIERLNAGEPDVARRAFGALAREFEQQLEREATRGAAGSSTERASVEQCAIEARQAEILASQALARSVSDESRRAEIEGEIGELYARSARMAERLGRRSEAAADYARASFQHAMLGDALAGGRRIAEAALAVERAVAMAERSHALVTTPEAAQWLDGLRRQQLAYEAMRGAGAVTFTGESPRTIH